MSSSKAYTRGLSCNKHSIHICRRSLKRYHDQCHVKWLLRIGGILLVWESWEWIEILIERRWIEFDRFLGTKLVAGKFTA